LRKFLAALLSMAMRDKAALNFLSMSSKKVLSTGLTGFRQFACCL